MDNSWLSTLAIKAMRICRLNKEAAGNHRKDVTRPILEQLLRDGYQTVQWNSNGSHHSECLDLNRQQWTIEDFISGLLHDAPMFEKSHPGCSSCSITISGNELPSVELDSFGDMDAAIGTSRPVVKTPVKQPKVKPLQKPQETIVEEPIKPKKKVVQIPEGTHKQLKDPFEKRELSDSEYEDWLKTLEQENINESIPSVPTEDERNDWLHDLERETSQKIPHWISGLFKGN